MDAKAKESHSREAEGWKMATEGVKTLGERAREAKECSERDENKGECYARHSVIGILGVVSTGLLTFGAVTFSPISPVLVAAGFGVQIVAELTETFWPDNKPDE